MRGEVVDLFAGPGGWDIGARDLGLDPLGIEWDADACATRIAAGLRTLEADVAGLDPQAFGPIDGLIGSPPCQAFSQAGARGGDRDAARILDCMAELMLGRDTRAALRDELGEAEDALFGFATEDPRSLLVVEPLRWAVDLRPRWIALEQVPPVLPLWEVTADHLRTLGYHTWTGKVRADEYGVPQTRERAVLLASTDGPVAPPVATHQRWAKGRQPERPTDAAGRLPWVVMAEALGWGMTARPSVTVTAANGNGASRPLDGGTGSRDAIRRAQEGGEWADIEYDRRTGPGVATAPRMGDEPAPTVTAEGVAEGVHVWRFRGPGYAHATERAPDEPAPTIAGGNGAVPEWHQARPRQDAPPPVRVSLADAATLQGFPAGYPWQGSDTAAFRQIGNAVPPPMARALLAAVIGAPS